MQADPLPPLRRGGREVGRADEEVEWLSTRRFLSCSRSARTAALGLARRGALAGRLATGRLALAGRFVLGCRLAAGRLIALGVGLFATDGCTAGLSAIGDIPARAFEDNAHRLENPSHCAGARRTCSQRLVLEGLKLLELRAAGVTGIDIGRHIRAILLVMNICNLGLLYMIYGTRSNGLKLDFC